MIVTGGLVVTVCKVILLYKAKVGNSLLGNHRLVVWIYGRLRVGLTLGPLHIEGVCTTSLKCC